jgi:hypothetical protein
MLEGDGDGNGDRGDGDGGGNSSKISSSSWSLWALAGLRRAIISLPKSSKGTQNTAVSNVIGRLNKLKDLVMTGNFPN